VSLKTYDVPEESIKVITKELEFEVDATFVWPTTEKEGPQINTIIQFRGLYGSGQWKLNRVNSTIKIRIRYGSELNIIRIRELTYYRIAVADSMAHFYIRIPSVCWHNVYVS
jgi:hypothetical protein